MNGVMQATDRLKERRDASPVPSTAGRAKADDLEGSKPVCQSRGENTRDGAGSNVDRHTVYVLGLDGRPLTPTSPARARRLLKGGRAKKVWSRFGTFGVQMLFPTREETPHTSLGVDFGTKFEGYAVVCGIENPLSAKLDLPNKKAIVRKMLQRKYLRRSRRHRGCRRRPARHSNRARRAGWLAPSQAVIVAARLRVIREFLRLFPVASVGLEDVRFNHRKFSWGSNFTTVEVGKARVRKEILACDVKLYEFAGYQTQELRKKYGYRKSRDKSRDVFEAHCTDALALACETGPLGRVEPGRFVVVDDSYRPVRRRLHDTQPASGGVRANYSRGTVHGVSKGVLVGAANGNIGRLCGELKGGFRYHDWTGKRCETARLRWISRKFIVKRVGEASSG